MVFDSRLNRRSELALLMSLNPDQLYGLHLNWGKIKGHFKTLTEPTVSRRHKGFRARDAQLKVICELLTDVWL